MKKIILLLLLINSIFSLWFNSVFADDSVWPPTEQEQRMEQRKEDCARSWDCIDQPTFMIDTSIFSPWWGDLKQGNSQDTINNVFLVVIQKLMIGIGLVSFLVIAIWAGYMLIYHGEDEYLSKWKSIVIGGIVALIVALVSYYLVDLLGYVLYTQN